MESTNHCATMRVTLHWNSFLRREIDARHTWREDSEKTIFDSPSYVWREQLCVRIESTHFFHCLAMVENLKGTTLMQSLMWLE
jgi:hypothetical protein